ncbi:methyl-accepting chemotaxis protein [Pseudomonas sp. RP23018S]|nr:methyl-accepting chemotaxis protein [Pseudomonas sp. RP23018S]MDZ5602837.1 methyl-accepting chemotaxis protein [Pseudomonas sp. RP23018S]
MSLPALSLKWRITLLSGLCLLAVVVSILCATLWQSQRISQALKQQSTEQFNQLATARLDDSARAQAGRMQRLFDDSRLYVEGVAEQLLQLQAQHDSGLLGAEPLRRQLVATTAAALARRPQVLGLYVVFERNALDGQDNAFIEQTPLASNSTGRFALYWSQAQAGQPQQTALTEDNILLNNAPPGSEPENNWYLCPASSGKACVIEPYAVEVEGQNTLMSSVAVPMMKNGKVIGVIGVDIRMSTLQTLTGELQRQLYDAQATVSLTSATGLPVAKVLGSDVQPQAQVNTPFTPIDGARPWSLQVQVPQPLLLAPALQLQADFDQASREATWRSLGWGAGCALLGLLILGWAARSATRPLLHVADALDRVVDGDGDLTQRLPPLRAAEPARLTDGFNRFLEKLQPLLHTAQDAASETRACASRSAEITRAVDSDMFQQHGQVEQTATALVQMGASAEEIARNAAQAAEATRSAEHATQAGLAQFQTTRDGIGALDDTLGETLSRLQALANSGAQINQVLDVISTLAQKTNLLALNAAIEAARAGEHGRGFAVVADEVRHLASSTQASTREIREVVERLHSLTENAMSGMLDSRGKAEHVVEQIGHSHASLQTIRHSVDTLHAMNQQIASATTQQHGVIDDMAQRMTEIRSISQRLTERMAASNDVSRTLDTLAENQRTLLAQFRT